MYLNEKVLQLKHKTYFLRYILIVYEIIKVNHCIVLLRYCNCKSHIIFIPPLWSMKRDCEAYTSAKITLLLSYSKSIGDNEIESLLKLPNVDLKTPERSNESFKWLLFDWLKGHSRSSIVKFTKFYEWRDIKLDGTTVKSVLVDDQWILYW